MDFSRAGHWRGVAAEMGGWAAGSSDSTWWPPHPLPQPPPFIACPHPLRAHRATGYATHPTHTVHPAHPALRSTNAAANYPSHRDVAAVSFSAHRAAAAATYPASGVQFAIPADRCCGGCGGIGGRHDPRCYFGSITLDGGLMGSVGGPQSPLDMKPDTASLMGSGNFSPTGSSGGGGPNSPTQGKSSSGHQYPPNHPLSGSKHLCSICGDRASGKHYGVYSCEGCKGFFKRTVRKDLSYACREEKTCIIDKRQRNRCQYCRYQKCLAMGMKREAVQERMQDSIRGGTDSTNRYLFSGMVPISRGPLTQIEERQRTKGGDQSEVESTSSLHADMPVERILEAEKRVEYKTEHNIELENTMNNICQAANICQATNKQLFQLVEWAKHIPHFTSLPLEDQVLLLRAGWNELLIAAFSHRSMEVKDGIVLATGLTIHRNSAHQAGVGTIFDRVLTELVAKMREMKMDKTELGCLRSVILFNPDVRGLKSQQEVEILREKVYAALEEYTRNTHPDEPGRFAKLLLRLPALRSIGLKCLEHLFFFRLIGDVPIDTFLMEMLESPSDS